MSTTKKDSAGRNLSDYWYHHKYKLVAVDLSRQNGIRMFLQTINNINNETSKNIKFIE